MSHALGCLSCTLVRFSLSPLPARAPCHGHQHRRRGRRNACQRQRQKQRRQNAAAAHAGSHEFKATLEMLVADPDVAACVRALWRRLKGRVRPSIPQSTVCRTTFSPNLPSRSHLNGPKQLRKGLGQVAFFSFRCPPRCPERWEILRESIKCHCYNSWNALRPCLQPGFLRHICGTVAWLLHVECWRALRCRNANAATCTAVARRQPMHRNVLAAAECDRYSRDDRAWQADCVRAVAVDAQCCNSHLLQMRQQQQMADPANGGVLALSSGRAAATYHNNRLLTLQYLNFRS